MPTIVFCEKTLQATLQYASDFSSLDDFWWEGTPDVTVRDGSLFVRAALVRDERYHFVSSVFCCRPLQGNLLIEFDVRNSHPESKRNFNFFMHTTLADGRDLYQTRSERTGDYPEYHSMNNYLFTYVPGRSEAERPDAPEVGRWRFRRNPGFRLIKEIHAVPFEPQRWRHFQYLVHDGLVACSVDRDPLETYGWRDPEPLTQGHFGFRTFCSHLEYRELRVWSLA